ncbi:cadmium-translocating P-type ATPase [Berryella wangjianweii]|uniref:Cadmium-translocating P-type ATPase n=1 Tax=Berryella wangjianweii TaxID=2734634 RepID=A0A6M8J2G7_9ACTN|nr:heavy metal translocating P-type ATPase [Berryella wangjianweii]QKF07724.1 cadmium-translocating P-type ATPase [Berryella wangjianweii]
MSTAQKKNLLRILSALVLLVAFELTPFERWLDPVSAVRAEFALFLVPYLIAGHDVLARAARGVMRGRMLDESFLMAIATIGAFALVLFPEGEPHMAEGAAVMIFYQIGEWFQNYAVDKSRKSIAEMMDIAPEFANVMRDDRLEQVSPYDVAVGDLIVVKPGERIPLDGTVVQGGSQLDTAALTGESVPRVVGPDSEVISGCVNMTGALTVRVAKEYEQSTVQRILELVESASEKKARTESFITRFARYYTPVVVGLAAAIAVIPPLAFQAHWADCVQSALIFLVVSCPCALVISVPLSFFGGIGAASRAGILVKGSSYLEALADTEVIAFDKTGTLTDGTFNVVAIHPRADVDPDAVLSMAAHAEAYSDHPIALSLRSAYTGTIDAARVRDVTEQGGHGVSAMVDEHVVAVGNDKLMSTLGIADWHACTLEGTVLHVALDGAYVGHIVIADLVKEDAAQAIRQLHAAGVNRAVMLTGDREEVAQAVAARLGIDEHRAQLLPQDKVSLVEDLLASTSPKGKLAFVGDGINDAPVLMRADIGIAMGAMGSDAAIEAADIVLMNDRPSNIALAIRIARKTMRIVWQNIVFAIGVKVGIMILALPVFGIANMWMAVFGDVGVAVVAIVNAMRALRVKRISGTGRS